MYKRADIKVGFACNNLCTFCVQGDKRYRFSPRGLQEIKDIIQEEYDGGARGVVFTGGEPTVHPNLVEAVAFANDIGYKQIQIQSNGTNFHREEYVKSLIDAGVTDFNPSIHGFNPETHDKQVGTPGAWEKVIKGLILLKKLNQNIVTNSVITQDNYKELPQLASLLTKIGVLQFQFAFVHILGSAAKNKLVVVPRKSEIISYVHKGLDIARKNNTLAYTEAIPYCLMQGYEWAIAENVIPETSVRDAEYKIDSYAEYRWNEGKKKRKECRGCSRYSECEGPWKEYPEIFGWNEFQPIITS